MIVRRSGSAAPPSVRAAVRPLTSSAKSARRCTALFIAAPASGQGKTTVTAALARWHRRQGRRVRVFKTGPDFLDPMIVQDGTREGQVVLAMELHALVRNAPAYGPRPGLLIIGETVRLSPHYRSGHPAALPARETRATDFSAAERASFYRLIEARRDMRHFAAGARVEPATRQRLFEAAHCAPSVGLMQPWRFLRVTEVRLREAIAELVDAERQATADALGERRETFLRLKVEGVRDCAELLVAALAPDDGTLFGRRTLPRETALCSLACAIENLWLAARAENLGLGWFSLFDPAALARLLEMPEGAQPVGVLCLGPVHRFYDGPMLENEGWRQRQPLSSVVYADRWGQADPDLADAAPA